MMMGWHWHQDISSVRNYYLKLRQSFCGGNCKEVLYYIILDFIYIFHKSCVDWKCLLLWLQT